MLLYTNMGENAAIPESKNLPEKSEEDDNMDQQDGNQEEDDITDAEFHALNDKMDELNSALDNLEQKNDVIYSELLKLLQESREIRKQIENENKNNDTK